MRIAIMISAGALILAGATAAPAAATPLNTTPAVAAVQAPAAALLLTTQDPAAQPATPKPDVDVNVKTTETTTWYASPFWITVGVIALVVVVLLIAMAMRGGGSSTTVIR